VSGFQEPYARKFNSLIIASDSRICPDKIDSLKGKPSTRSVLFHFNGNTSYLTTSTLNTKYIWALLIKLHDSAIYDDRRKAYEWLKHQVLKCN
jgi:hypothetical protein